MPRAAHTFIDLTQSSDDEHGGASPSATLPRLERGRSGIAQERQGGVDASDDEVVEVPPPAAPLRALGPACGADADGIELLGVRGPVRGAEAGALGSAPQQPASCPRGGPLALHMLTQAASQEALRDLAHPRFNCLNNPFASTPHAARCGKARSAPAQPRSAAQSCAAA